MDLPTSRGRRCLLLVLSVSGVPLCMGSLCLFSFSGCGEVRCLEVRCQAVRWFVSLRSVVGSTMVLGGGGVLYRDTHLVGY